LQLSRNRQRFDSQVLRILIASILISIGAEIAFIFYVDVYGLSNFFGHILKIISFYLIYNALVKTALIRPFDLLYRDLKISENTLRESEKRLQELNATKDRFFSIIAHDLKSPVLNISFMIDHLRKNNDGQTFEKVTESLSQQAVFATNLIDNLLLWGEGQQNQIGYNPGKHNLTDIILANFNLLHEISRRKKIDMTYSHRGDSSAICDHDLLNIVIRNILSNAVKFTAPNGKISVSVEEPLVKDGTISIIISDNGIGISQEKLQKIISGEVINSSEGTYNEKGTGLGLQLCYDLVRINKGSLTIESQEGKGTSFTIRLPSPSGTGTAV